MTSLDLTSTEELLTELMNRFTDGVFIGTKTEQANRMVTHLHCKGQNRFASIGLAVAAEHLMMQQITIEKQSNDENKEL